MHRRASLAGGLLDAVGQLLVERAVEANVHHDALAEEGGGAHAFGAVE